jgi:UDP:flavonoid glycosyltransferase YjiC (YdhE family)
MNTKPLSASPRRKKILFFSHAVTTTHFARPLKWIKELDPSEYEIYLASHPKFRKLCPSTGVTFIDIDCIDDQQFAEKMRRAAPVYDARTFEKHVEDDLHVMDLVQPDLVIGDFRHSLSVSCRLRKLKYVNLTNAYWNPNVALKQPLPEIPLVRKLGDRVPARFLDFLVPFVLRAKFFKMAFLLRKSFRRAKVHFRDYRQVMMDGDMTLFCDPPGLVPLKRQKYYERFVGPMDWSNAANLPEQWVDLDPKKKRIFVSLESAGSAAQLPLIVGALSKLGIHIDVDVIIASSGKELGFRSFPNIHFAESLGVEDACQSADLLICNGESSTCYSALIHGVPTIGIVSNNDQLLNMAHIENRGAGRMLRSWNLTEKKLTDAVTDILKNSSYRMNSQSIQYEFDQIDLPGHLRHVLREMLPSSTLK